MLFLLLTIVMLPQESAPFPRPSPSATPAVLQDPDLRLPNPPPTTLEPSIDRLFSPSPTPKPKTTVDPTVDMMTNQAPSPTPITWPTPPPIRPFRNGPEVEAYRDTLDRFRKEVERLRKSGELKAEDYHLLIEKYHEGIDQYKDYKEELKKEKLWRRPEDEEEEEGL